MGPDSCRSRSVGPRFAECASTESWSAMQILRPHRLEVAGWNQQSLLITPGRDSDTCQSVRTTGLENHYFFFPLKFFSSSLRNTQSFHHNELLRIHFVIHLLPTRLFKLRVSMHWVWWIKSYNNKSHNKYINKLPRTPLANLKIGMWLLSIQKTLNSCVGFSSCMLTCFTQLFLIQDLKEKPKNPERQIRWRDKL